MRIEFNWFDDRKARLQRAFEEVGYKLEEELLLEPDITDFDREIAESSGTLDFQNTDFSSELGIDNSFLFDPYKELCFTLFAQTNTSEVVSDELISSVIDSSNLDPKIVDDLFAQRSDEIASALDVPPEITNPILESSSAIINPFKEISPDLYFQIASNEISVKKIKQEPPIDFWRWN